MLLAGVAFRYLPLRAQEARKPGLLRSPGRTGAGADRAVPVQATQATTTSVRVVQNGLGTVVPYRSVNVTSRVSGQLTRVHFREGDLVEKGELLAEIDPRPFRAEVARVEGELVRGRAQLENAQLDLVRYQALGRERIAKQEDVQARHSLVRQYEAALHAERGSLEQAALQLSFTRITAPISGRIGLRQLDAGNNIEANAGTPLAVIKQTQPITVLFSVPEDDVQAVLARLSGSRKNGEALTVEAWDKGSRRRLGVGTLLTLDNQIDPGTGTLKLKAEFANEDGSLFPNQFVNVRLLLEIRRDSTVIPDAAVQYGSMGTFVWVVTREKTVTLRPVVLGPMDGALVIVKSGIQSGELVVTSGTDRLQDGTPVLVHDGASRGSNRKASSPRPPSERSAP